MNTEKLIAAIQSRISIRGCEIACLEYEYFSWKTQIVEEGNYQFQIARSIRQEIKPMAIAQAVDRQIMKALQKKIMDGRRFSKAMVHLSVFEHLMQGVV